MNNSSRITVMVEGALCVALSVVLGYFTLFRMPQGGSINLELVPIFLFSYRHGAKWGVQAGCLAGFMQLMLGGYMVHPVQAILDYPASFAALGLAGLWKNHLIAGTVLGGLTSMMCNVISGAVFFASYAPEGTNIWLYSIVYNGSFFLPKAVICGAVAVILFWRLKKVQK